MGQLKQLKWDHDRKIKNKTWDVPQSSQLHFRPENIKKKFEEIQLIPSFTAAKEEELR